MENTTSIVPEELPSQHDAAPTEAPALEGGRDMLIYATAFGGGARPDLSQLTDAVSPDGLFLPRVDGRVVIERWIEDKNPEGKTWFDTRTYLIVSIDQINGDLRLRDEDAGGYAMSNFKTAPKDRYTFKFPPKLGTKRANEVKKSKKRSARKGAKAPKVDWVDTAAKKEAAEARVSKPRRVYPECGGFLVLVKGERYFTKVTDLDVSGGLILGKPEGGKVTVTHPGTGLSESWSHFPKSAWEAAKGR